MSRIVYTVHATWLSAEPGGIEQGAIELVEDSEPLASVYAQQRSTDIGITAAVVTGLEVGRLGTRRIVEWWIKGERLTMADRDAVPFYIPEPVPRAGRAGRGG